MARNITEVHLLNVPLENDYKHTLYFSSLTAQTNYFLGRKVANVDVGSDFSYQRKDQIIRYPKDYDKLVGCNYVMYKNASYSNKWYYAFIKKMEYINDGMTALHIETDVIQTWMFDYTIKTSFVEREHCSDDTIGLHTVPEQLESGDYVINKKIKNYDIVDDYRIIVACTVDMLKADMKDVSGAIYNKVYSGVKYFVFNPDDIEQLNSAIEDLALEGKSDAIQSIFLAPYWLIHKQVEGATNTLNKSDAHHSQPWRWVQSKLVENNDTQAIFTYNTDNIEKPSKIDGYTPKNNKLFTYPYCYMMMSNNSGGSAIYKYELFNNKDEANLCDFRIHSAVTPGMSIRCIPVWYNGAEYNHEEGLNLGKFPICSWNTDVYTNWLTQNAVNIGVSLGSSAMQVVGGLAMAGTGAGAVVGASGITSGALGIASTLGEVYSHSLTPPQAEGNLNSGDVAFANESLTFTAYQMSIKKEYAQIIDNYFSMFGYKTNLVKIPNKNHRENYWFTKTIDINIDGAIPMDDMQTLKDCYNKGITFWKNPSNIQNYSVSNNII